MEVTGNFLKRQNHILESKYERYSLLQESDTDRKNWDVKIIRKILKYHWHYSEENNNQVFPKWITWTQLFKVQFSKTWYYSRSSNSSFSGVTSRANIFFYIWERKVKLESNDTNLQSNRVCESLSSCSTTSGWRAVNLLRCDRFLTNTEMRCSSLCHHVCDGTRFWWIKVQ